MGIRNEVIVAGGTAQDILPALHSWGGFIINAETEDMIIQFGSTAAVGNGEILYKDSPAKFSASDFPEFNSRVSIFSPTTGATFTIRPTAA